MKQKLHMSKAKQASQLKTKCCNFLNCLKWKISWFKQKYSMLIIDGVCTEKNKPETVFFCVLPDFTELPNSVHSYRDRKLLY